MTPLMAACLGGDDKPVRVLLNAGADANIMDANGKRMEKRRGFVAVIL